MLPRRFILQRNEDMRGWAVSLQKHGQNLRFDGTGQAGGCIPRESKRCWRRGNHISRRSCQGSAANAPLMGSKRLRRQKRADFISGEGLCHSQIDGRRNPCTGTRWNSESTYIATPAGCGGRHPAGVAFGYRILRAEAHYTLL